VKAHAPGEFNDTIMSGGVQRDYILHVPPQYDGSEPTPLVMLFHGYTLAGRSMLDYSEFGVVADSEGFLLVAPTATGDPHRWNAFPLSADVDDVAFVNDLVDELEAELCIDSARIFATGYSNGGGMSMTLACELPDRVKAVGLVAATFQTCTPHVPAIAFHGTEDPLVQFEGGRLLGPVRESVAKWAEALQCNPQAQVSRIGDHIELSSYDDCTGSDVDGAVQLYTVEGGGHTWPGATLFGDPAATTQEINASELIWEFFAHSPQ
jgi:polyhydroxybutyrate depolymerase